MQKSGFLYFGIDGLVIVVNNYLDINKHTRERDKMDEQQEQAMETMLISKMEELKTKAKEIIDGVMGDLYTEYLPYVVSDTEANIGSRVDGVIHNLIAGKFERIDERLVKVSDTYQCDHFIHINNYDDLVKPLCAAMGVDITNARIAQLEEEVKRLHSRLTEAYRRG